MRWVPPDNIASHMWFNIASINGIEDGAYNRDVISERISPEQVMEAERRAKVCMESNYKDCD